MSELEPAAARCLERTRSAVLNVLVADGLGIAITGIILRRRDRGALLVSDRTAQRGALLALLIVIVGSFVARRALGARSHLKDPGTRAARFFRAHLVSALIGALAVPLGLLYGWAARPELKQVLPFWVTALALGVLAVPRAQELSEFDAPMAEPSGGQS